MEEILASIRRIIADEPQKSPAPPAAANAAPAPAEDDEVMELKPKARVKEPHFITDDPVDNDVSFADRRRLRLEVPGRHRCVDGRRDAGGNRASDRHRHRLRRSSQRLLPSLRPRCRSRPRRLRSG